MVIYTIFTLADPASPDVVRFIGCTSQTLSKRVGGLIVSATNPTQQTYKTALGTWLRELATRPLAKAVYETSNREDGIAHYRLLLKKLIPLGNLLNTRPGMLPGRPLVAPIVNPGRPTDISSVNAERQRKRKT